MFQYLTIMIFPPLMMASPNSMATATATATDTATNPFYRNCSRSVSCGQINISYPFFLYDSPAYCGFPGYELSCNHAVSTLTINLHGNDYLVKEINYDEGFVTLVDTDFLDNSCPQTFSNTSINSSLFDYSDSDLNLTVYVNCPLSLLPGLSEILCLGEIFGQHSYYKLQKGPAPFLLDILGCNLTAAVPLNQAVAATINGSSEAFVNALRKGFGLTWNAGKDWCKRCVNAGGVCGYNSSNANEPTCFCPNNTALGSCPYATKGSSNTGLIIGVSIAGSFSFIVLASLCILLYCYWRRRHGSSSNLSERSISFVMSSSTDTELASNLYSPIFSYEELYIATNGFDASKELGNGGFGTVYKGKLKDDRVVAVKRLYENNCRRLEQFMNEVNILSQLRHQNLVSLYGCTSHRSRELLLVYEYVANGTVADHLHGPHAAETVMPWQTRMSIAIETADALNYLHSVEPQIIHRDVKTNNILLDNSFHVKVADFGLSRLFPLDATHVSTAPQGTPGYVDPEYHQCFQLTDKSDVYSFGVVLMELISSKPAVDTSRDRSEVILANMAIKKIQRQELHEFMDPRLGFHSDCSIHRMITQVAALAFQCLLSEGEMRPGIKEVLEILRGIERGGKKNEGCLEVEETVVGEEEEGRLLKGLPPYSPNSVTEAWLSTSSTMSTFSL